MTVLSAGANAPLPAADTISVRLSTEQTHADLIALVLDADGRADGDDGVVLFSHPVSAGGAVELDQAQDTVHVRIDRLPSKVCRVVFVAQADETPSLTAAGRLSVAIAADDVPFASALFDGSSFPTLQVAELYQRNGAWKVRALGDGYADGLAKLLTVHGVEVDDPAPAPVAAPPQPEVASPPPPPPPMTSSAPTVDASSGPPLSFRKVTGQVQLTKGDKPVMLDKAPGGGKITASVTWPPATDYDVFALVLLKGGKVEHVGAIEAQGVKPKMSYKGIKHLGDVKRSKAAVATEKVEIVLSPEIIAVVPVVYSTINNGLGSFKKYKVTLAIDNHAGTKISIDPQKASRNPFVFSCVPGLIRNTPEGVVIEPLELYSRAGSENRPDVRLVGDVPVVTMDAGPVNKFKKR